MTTHQSDGVPPAGESDSNVGEGADAEMPLAEDRSTENYGGVPDAWLPNLGRIAVSSGRIEFAAYQIARMLDLRQPKNGRSPSFSSQCEAIRQRLEDSWRPA